MTGQKRRTGGRSARVRRDVIASAIEILEQRGPFAFSVISVAERAGVHPTTIYRRWKDAENLALDAALHAADLQIPLPDTGNLHGDLLALFTHLGAYIQSPLGRAFLVLAIAAGPSGNAARDTFWEIRLRRAAELLERAERRGEIAASADHASAIEDILAPLYFAIFIRRKPADRAILEHCANLAMKMLSAH